MITIQTTRDTAVGLTRVTGLRMCEAPVRRAQTAPADGNHEDDMEDVDDGDAEDDVADDEGAEDEGVEDDFDRPDEGGHGGGPGARGFAEAGAQGR